ncbi:MAG: hypothetical protein KDA05_06060 [Phycisphaerales bacterium]|nr:hypothetical protein [Phycisphaerales bacterium]MCB9840907.1 hypothetical protein [Phycisphaeraceae bacterium]
MNQHDVHDAGAASPASPAKQRVDLRTTAARWRLVTRRARVAGLVGVAGLSVAGGIGAIALLIRPDVVGLVSTPMLLGIVGMVVLPGASAAAVGLERRVVARSGPPVAGAEQSVRRETAAIPPASYEAVEHPPESGTSDAHADAWRHRHARADVRSDARAESRSDARGPAAEAA